MTHQAVQSALRKFASTAKAKAARRFFKTGPGQYGHQEQFLGVTVPEQRRVVKAFKALPLTEIWALLASDAHEDRLTALLILTGQYPKASPNQQNAIIDGFLTHKDRVNQWDLVDSTAHQLLGTHVLNRQLPLTLLTELAHANSLWDRRIAMVATYAFIKAGQFEPTFQLADILLNDPEDLIHKAVGWMLREVGKAAEKTGETRILEDFLTSRYRQMPRTMVRYAIEKWPADKRQKWSAKSSSKQE